MTSGVGRRTRLARAVVIPGLLLGLTACTGEDGADRDESPGSRPAEDSAAGSAGGADKDADGDPGGDAGATTGADFATAADTALAEVDGTVVEVGHESAAWDVVVVTDDGSEHEIDLSADAAMVTRHRVETAADDPDDAAERRRLLGARVDLVTALETALAEVNGTVSGVGLSEDDGVVAWEVELDEETPDAATVVIDARTGEVLRTESGG